MLRTIRRVSLPLNSGKWAALCDIARHYRDEKNAHLAVISLDEAFTEMRSHRNRRDDLVGDGYESPHGLQARMWKMALKDAHETVVKQWASLAEQLRPMIARHSEWTKEAKHYANWLIYSERRMAALVSGRAPESPFEVPDDDRHRVRNYLRRVIRKKRGSRPRGKLARSICFDANMYSLFEQSDVQYISLMSQQRGKRVIVPLTGSTPITGNIRAVLDVDRKRVEIHYTANVKRHTALPGEPRALDAGITEVFTDARGNRYGKGLGAVLMRASDTVCANGKARNKLHQIAKAAEERGDHEKAKNIRKFNLGRKKLNTERRKARIEIERQINTAYNEFLKKLQPCVTITERLDIRGKAKSKRLSRLVSNWMRSSLKNRVEFKASAGGSRREQVNAAYSSQTCPVCWFVSKDNRHGDTFQCLNCGHIDDADRVAADNLEGRFIDPDITLYTPRERVREILVSRFNARLESLGRSMSLATVSGRTSAVVCITAAESETAGANPGARCA